jgi:hypothetical protein
MIPPFPRHEDIIERIYPLNNIRKMTSYCDIKTIGKTPDFEQRLNNWTGNGRYSSGGCVSAGTTKFPTCGGDPKNQSCCLNDAEIACYSSYQLGKTREKLDADLQEINDPSTSRAQTIQSNYENTMMASIVWAMLGTTVLYFAFTKI